MPIPNPHKNEKKEDFVSRCMGDEVMNKEYPDQKKRSGICYSQWENKNKKGGSEMLDKNITMDEFKMTYPELFAQIEKEAFEKGILEGMEKGKLSGAESERNRIKSVEQQMIPECKDLVESLKYDGKTTGPEAAIRVLQEYKKFKENRHEDLLEDGKKAKVKDANPPEIEKVKEVNAATELEKIAKEKMKADKNLSYRDALIEAQKENPELAQKIKDSLDLQREKNKD